MVKTSPIRRFAHSQMVGADDWTKRVVGEWAQQMEDAAQMLVSEGTHTIEEAREAVLNNSDFYLKYSH